MKRTYRIFVSLVLVLSILSAPLGLCGQGFKQYTTLPNQHQLPVANIHRILQDKAGYMWYATYGGGLCRDDGYRVDVFRPHQLGSRIPVQSNYVECMSEDTKGRIWMGTRSGLYYVDTQDFQIHEPDSSLRSEFIYSVCCADDGTVWFSLRGELLHIDGEGKRLAGYTLRDPYQHPVAVRHLIQNSKGELMGCATWNMGLIRYDKHSDRVEYLPWQIEGSPQYMIEDQRNQCYWVCTWGRGVVRYKDGQATEQPSFWHPDAVQAQQAQTIAMDLSLNGTLWVSTMEFLYAFDTSGGVLTPVSTKAYLPRQLMMVDGVLVDRQDNVWVGGFTPNTFILSSLNHQIQRDSLPQLSHLMGIRTMLERVCHDGQGGSWIFQSRRGIVYVTPQGEVQVPPLTDRYPNYHLVFSACHDGVGVWAANKKDVGHLWCDESGWHSDIFIGVHDDINDILEDDRGVVWVGGTHSLSCYDRRDGHLLHSYDGVGGVKSLCCSKDGTLYCLSDTLGVLRLSLGKSPETILAGTGFNTLALTPDNTLYVSTSDGQVLQCQSGTSTFEANRLLSSHQGEMILKMLVDPLGHVWTLTDQHVRESNPKKNVSRLLSCHDNEINLNFFCDMSFHDGKVWLCGPGGLVGLEPNAAMDNPSHVEVPHISAITYNEERHLLCPQAASFVLPYDAHNISVEFTTLNYLHTAGIQYRYRLVGYDRDWTLLPEGSNSAIFAKLPAGRYTLEVAATDRFGSWSTNVATLQIEREPAWWETWWFRALIVVFALGLLVLIVYLLNRRHLHHRQHQMEQRLTEMKFQFFTNISHELRTPLTLIATPLDSIKERLQPLTQADADTVAYVKKKLQGISLHTHELAEMINRLLDFRKLEMKEQQLHLSNGDVCEFVRSAVESFRPLAEKQGIALGINLPSSSLYMHFDADKLHHILSNLLSNAVKFTDNGGSVVTSLHTLPNKMIEITVADTGVGIDADELPHIFERYYQASNAQSGSGIGLQLVDSFCRLHGGSVSAESRVGQGTTFTVVLPTNLRGSHVAEAHDVAEVEQPADSTGQPLHTLLVVDDNAELRELLVDEFQSQYRILQAADGQEALNVLHTEEVDLVVSDVMMPVMDGFALCESIRRDINISHLLVILLTAKAAEDSKLQGFKSGADAYLSKPFSMEMLKVRIATLLQQRHERHQAFQHQEEVDITETAVDELDREFLQHAVEMVEQHLDDENYDVDAFCLDLAMSKSTLYRKLGSISGQKPKEFIRTIRLRHAAKLLKGGRYTVSEVATRTGFSYVSYFCKCFKDMYGVQPGNYK